MSNADVTPSHSDVHESSLFYTTADDGVHLACVLGDFEVTLGHHADLEGALAAWKTHLAALIEHDATQGYPLWRVQLLDGETHQASGELAIVRALDEESARAAAQKRVPDGVIGMAERVEAAGGN